MGMLLDVLTRMLQLEAQGGTGVRTDVEGRPVCYYCGRSLEQDNTHADHVAPRKRGGPDRSSNLVLACAQCNERKNAKHPLDWLAEQQLPPEIEVDVVARLLLGVWVGWPRRQRAEDVRPVTLTWGEWSIRTALPAGYQFGDVVGQQLCPECGGHGAALELPEGTFALLRCGMCGFVDIVKLGKAAG